LLASAWRICALVRPSARALSWSTTSLSAAHPKLHRVANRRAYSCKKNGVFSCYLCSLAGVLLRVERVRESL
jgi:hypothetical protein